MALTAAGLLTLSQSAGASDHSGEIVSSWTATPLFENGAGPALKRFRLFQRYVASPAGGFRIGIVTYLEAPIPRGEDPFRSASVLREALGVPAWSSERRRQDARAYEGFYEIGNRSIRLYVRPLAGDRIALSIATYRSSYAAPVALETELLQRRLLGLSDPAFARSNFGRALEGAAGIWELLASRAVAQPAPGCGTCAPGDLTCITGLVACNTNTLVGQIGTLQGSVDTLVASAADFNKQFGELKDTLDKRWGDTNNQLVEFNKQLDRANDTAELFAKKLFDPMTAFVSAGAAALGVMAANLAVEGIALAGKELIELITGAKEEARIRERFARAQGRFDDATANARNLERALDGLIVLNDLSAKFRKTRENLFRVGPLVARVEAEAVVADEKLLKAVRHPERYSPECRAQLAVAVSELKELADNLKSVKGNLAAPAASATDKKQFCETANTLMSKIFMAEAELQTLRSAIGDGTAQRLWQDEWHLEEERSKKAFESVTETAQENYEGRIKFLRKRRDRVINHASYLEEVFVHDCEPDEMGMLPGFAVIPSDLLSGPGYGPERESDAAIRCRRKYPRTKQGKDQAAKVAKAVETYDSETKLALQERDHVIEAGKALRISERTSDRGYHGFKRWVLKIYDEQIAIETRMDALEAKEQRIGEMCVSASGKKGAAKKNPARRPAGSS